MIVLLFSVMAGLATLARGVLFTVAACLVLAAGVAVLYVSLRVVGTLGGPEWIPGVLAILAFVLAIGGPAYLLVIREGSTPGGASADQHPTDDGAASDPDPGVEEGATAEQVSGEADDRSDADDERTDIPDPEDDTPGTPGG